MAKDISEMKRPYGWPGPGFSPRRALNAVGVVSSLAFLLAGCADNPKSPFPSTGSISGLGTILSPEERQKAISDLHKQDEAKAVGAKDAAKQ